MTFHIGQMVVCVDDDFIEVIDEIVPVKGVVYTIRGFDPDDEHGSVFLEEIVNEEHFYEIGGYGECSFRLSRFRPVAKTDISIFTAMLHPAPEHETAP